ncbi:UNVERIFIED_CONTAM: hypothetical protein K2H54_028864 [Gekko kuhli]
MPWVSVCLCCGFLCLDELSGSVLQPSESKSNVTPFTVLAYVLCTIQPYAHLVYIQRLIPHQSSMSLIVNEVTEKSSKTHATYGIEKMYIENRELYCRTAYIQSPNFRPIKME